MIMKPRNQIYSSIAFFFVIIVIGIPMWWKSTEVYRDSLPYHGIEMLSHIPIKISSRIGICTFNENKSNQIIEELKEHFQQHAFLNLQFHQIVLGISEYNLSKTAIHLESLVLSNLDVRPGDFLLIEWDKITEDILLTSRRTGFFSPFISSQKIVQVITTIIFEEHKLRLILGNLTLNNQQNVERLATSAPKPHYDVLISILNPRPSLQTIHWDVRSAADRYIKPFLDSLSPFSNFTLVSQWKYQAEFEFSTNQVLDDSKIGRHYSLYEENLPHIITAVEKKLGTDISSSPCIHLIVYIPPCQNSPLHVYKKNGQRSKNNIDSFISSKWGAIIIYNPPENICLEHMARENPVEFSVNSNDVMQIMLYLLRKLMDIQNNIQITGVSVEDIDTITPRDWESDTFIRNGVIHLLSSATLTLKSLTKLLGDIGNIVINDEVGACINEAYENIVIAKSFIKTGDIYNASVFAKKAFISSEAAFFDPTLLALLYFPSEQLYAIYIPLFLPIMIPVILSLVSFKKYFFVKQ